MRQHNCSIEYLACLAGVTEGFVWYRMNFATRRGHVEWLLEIVESPPDTGTDGTMVEIELSDRDRELLAEVFPDASWKERLSYALSWRHRDDD